MAVLLRCDSVSKSFGARVLFRDLSLGVSDGERLGVIGPNGGGKSTLLEILAGIQEPDSGSVSMRKLTRVGYVPQDSVFASEDTIADILARSAATLHIDEHERAARVYETAGKCGFTDLQRPTAELSGGWKKRLAIAAELVKAPDALLLDEPTNHLDLEGVLWLEKLLVNSRFASIVISHDRYFLENVATSMAEIDRAYPGGLFYSTGNYGDFLERKAAFLAAQAQRQEALENQVRREVEWLRRGPKARTSKSRARIQNAGRLMNELADAAARMQTATAQIDFTASERKTKKLLAAENLSKSLGGRELFRDLNLTLRPGERLGLVGPNGSGKTTLLRILAGELEPDAGVVERAENLQIVYFAQDRDVLEADVSLKRALAPEGDSVLFRGRPIHVAGWAKRFLFRPEQLEMPVESLSGGERARVLIARLMLMPADLLLLDEPTNDLDIPTLELLEQNLLDFAGALVLVTHDRYMLDRVSTSVLGLDGAGRAELYADYSQWEQERQPPTPRREEPRPAASAPATKPPAERKKLSYLEQREWDQMEALITDAEAEVERCQAALQDPQVVTDGALLESTYARLQAAQERVDRLYQRWAELETKLA